jgi:hypothetical protein
MTNIIPNSNLPSSSQPWGREIQKRLQSLEIEVARQKVNSDTADSQLQSSYKRLDNTIKGIAGGISNQILFKKSDANYDTQWVNPNTVPGIIGSYDEISNRLAEVSTPPVHGEIIFIRNRNAFIYYNDNFGWRGLIQNPVDPSNLFVGSGSNSSLTGTNNVGVGVSALSSNTSGQSNTAIGSGSLFLNQIGAANTALGFTSMERNSSGSRNTALGFRALALNEFGDDNIAIGFNAFIRNVQADRNVVIGNYALSNSTANTSEDNVVIGHNAGLNATFSFSNVIVGSGAATNLTSGSGNIVIGRLAQPSSATANNEITLGHAGINLLRCAVTTITALSDERDKKDITELDYGLDFIGKLRPVKFTWNTRDGLLTDKSDIGFIAQDLAAVEDELDDHDRLRLTLRNNEDRLEATPGRLLPIAIKAIQELSQQNEELKARLDKLEGKV